MKIGDTIKCVDREELVNTMYQLESEGYKTDFLFEKGGKSGYWIKIVGRYKECDI